MINFINIVSFIVAVLVIWFKTDAFVEYCKILKIKIPLNTTDLTYPQFLFVTYKNEKTLRSFFIKLITCPMCLGFWLSVLLGIPFFGFIAVPVIYVATLFIYFLLVRVIG